MSRQQTDAYGGKVKELDVMAVRSPHAPPRAMILVDGPTPFDPRVFVRGNPSQPGRAVPRQFLEILTPPGRRRPFTQGSGRLELARAITSSDNPLTARVIVNRVWMYHFGEPLVATPSDFGTRTAPPAQLDLLDRLAFQLQRDGWSIKALHRRIILSRAYQQAAVAGDAAAAGRRIDPDNRLLWRMNRQRLDWEAMRDTLLAVSGRLELRSGGRPIDVAGDPQARVRTVFGLVDRQSLPGVFRAFDFASPDVSIERRVRTMVPQQALFALNSSLMLTQAKSLAGRPEIVAAIDSPARVTAMYRVVFGRAPTDDERAD
ncbi:MAG TPA: DUF1553 domain-containing protein, partial [Pirellulaceae bacterium]|nr:DUF1553 domain-containing protein [Pirellulaceae bacterium]